MSKITLAPNAAGTAIFTVASPATSTNRTLTLPDFDGTVTVQGSTIVRATAVASTSGTSIDFTGIPSWVKRVTVMLSGVSTNGTSSLLVRLGTSGGIASTGYSSVGFAASGSGDALLSSTTGLIIFGDLTTESQTGAMVITNLSGNIWTETYSGFSRNEYRGGGGGVTLSGTLDRVRVTTVNGTDTFDAGTVNIMYEG